MTKGEFTTEFHRLCKGFRYEPTTEQGDAWFRKTLHYERPDWSNAVDTLLCSPRFPTFDYSQAALDTARESRKRHEIQKDARTADRRVENVMSGRGCPLYPDLFNCIKAFSGRNHVRRYIAIVESNDGDKYEPLEQQEELAILKQREEKLTVEYERLLRGLSQADGDAFTVRYGAEVLA